MVSLLMCRVYMFLCLIVSSSEVFQTLKTSFFKDLCENSIHKRNN